MSLTGKTALVTGAHRGLGAATALALADLGATVIACGRREGDCADVVEAIAAKGGKASDLALDVADLAAIPERIATALALTGRIDILVNNAATIEPMAPLARLDATGFDRAMRVNVAGPAALVAALWPAMSAGSGGRIINVVSGAAREPLPGWAAYCASKAALLMFTRSITLEGADAKILGFAFAPGLVDTDMQAAIRQSRINRVADIPRENLLAPDVPARVIARIAAGEHDDLAGAYIDIRDRNLGLA
jgi:NAD(P)-dependent dehydrogenase (short-subunit alcohol dehydrogenase family)